MSAESVESTRKVMPMTLSSSSPPGGHSGAPGSFRAPDKRNDEAIIRAEGVEERLRLSAEALTAILALEAVKGFGPQKFKELYDSGVTPDEVIAAPSRLPTKGGRGDAFRKALAEVTGQQMRAHRARAVRQLVRAHQHGAVILTYTSTDYPRNVWESNNPVPVLYVQGDPAVLAGRRAVACVGSRNTSGRYAARHEEFASHAARQGFTIVSGFALGADTIGHKAARNAGGKTLCVMPCGLDRPFPPENRKLWQDLLEYPGATMVSEFPFGTAASALTLRKRNKLIVAAALGVLVSQSSAKGGAMNAYRFALEQKKLVATFEPNGTDATSGNDVIRKGEPPSVVFPAENPDLDSWDQWLRKLSSSI
jgi:DNA protecting protein DprA